MNKVSIYRFTWLTQRLMCISILLLAAGCTAPTPPVQSSIVAELPAGPTAGFARAEGPQALSFPRDFGPHPDFQTEWWYYTGNLADASGARFGFQLTFFRRALQPPDQRARRTSDWAVSQVYLAHFTITDGTSNRFSAHERLERGAAGLAGAQSEGRFKVWLHDWTAEQTGAKAYHLFAEENGQSIDLQLTDLTGPVLQGDAGYSRKGTDPGNASYYFSQPRLQTRGTITLGGRSYAVSGFAWMDHEFSTSSLEPDIAGWDWFALQLDDGSELMVYDFRKKDGSFGAYSNGLLVKPDGSTRRLSLQDFKIETLSTWKSPHTGAVYPAKWRVSVPALGLSLEITPLVADQELNLSYSYWEGAVKIQGTRDGKSISGYGYVELTGYARPMTGV